MLLDHSLIRICQYLSYEDLVRIGSASQRLGRAIFRTETGGLPSEELLTDKWHDQLWYTLCVREGISNEDLTSCSDYRILYEHTCVSFYIIEFSAPGAREELILCENHHSVVKTIEDRINKDDERLIIQHICRSGMDIVVYVCYKNHLLNVTPIYDNINLKIGDKGLLKFRYLGGIKLLEKQKCETDCRGMNDSSDYSNWHHDQISELEDRKVFENASYDLVHKFYRAGRICRYEITYWMREAEAEKHQELKGLDDVEHLSVKRRTSQHCPPNIFCDIMLLPIEPQVAPELPALHPAAAPSSFNWRRQGGDRGIFKVELPIELDAVGCTNGVFELGNRQALRRSLSPSPFDNAPDRYLTLRAGSNALEPDAFAPPKDDLAFVAPVVML